MERTYTIEEIYEVVRREESNVKFRLRKYGPDSEQYQAALAWYAAIGYAFYAITGVHYNDYKEEHADEV